MKIDTSLGFIFLQTANFYRNNLEKRMTGIGLHYAQIFVLSLLWGNDGQSQIDISNALNLSQPTVNKMVKSLAQNDFVICNKCGNDGRIMRVFLTEKGQKAQSFVLEEIENLQTEFFSLLTETEQLIFKSLCEKLCGNALRAKAA